MANDVSENENITVENLKVDRLKKLRQDHQFESQLESHPNLKTKNQTGKFGKRWWLKFLLHPLKLRNKNLKPQNRVKSITIISILLALLLFTTNISNTLLSNSTKLNQNSTQIAQKMLQILGSLRNRQNLQNSIQEANNLISTLEQELKPLDDALWPILSTRNLTSESWVLGQKWILAVADIAQFKISAEGLTSDLPKNFTQYLEVFLNDLPALITQTEQFLQKIKNLTSWVIWFPHDTIAKLGQYLDLGSDILELTRLIYQNRDAILDFLGHRNIHKILIFNQNLGESRPTGGFIGSFLSVNITQGRFDIGKSESIYILDEDRSDTLMAFPVNWYYDLQYGRYSPHGVRNLNYFSCFPDSASLIEAEFSQSKKGQSADTIVFLTPNLIRNLFDSQTELKIDLNELANKPNSSTDTKNEITLTQANFYDQIEKLTAIEIQDPQNPK